MTYATVKIPTTTHQTMKHLAAQRQLNLSNFLTQLVEREAKRNKLERLRQQRADTRPELQTSYRDELSAWESVQTGGANDDE